MSMSEKFITYINEHGSTLPESEAEIGELISASLENGILTCSTATEDAYFSFVFLSTERTEPTYEVCFGKNPDRTAHPTAERALRASEFVTRLLNVVNTRHSCHIVAADVIVDPVGELSDAERKKLTARLFTDPALRIRATEAETELDGENDDVVAHELDVMLYASADSEFARVSACVHITESGGKLHFALGEGQSALKQRRAGEESQLSLTEERKREAADILDKINANYEEYTNAILSAIAGGEAEARAAVPAGQKAPDTPFLSFLERAAETTNRVGMIRVLPCALFVGAATAKTFRYQLSGELSFHLSWNEKSAPARAEDLVERLFVIREDNTARFRGFTYRDTLKGKKLSPLGTNERVALDCYFAEDGKLVRGNAIVKPAEKRTCRCGATFYADEAYMKAHTCLDGSYYCDLCNQNTVRSVDGNHVTLREASRYTTGAHGLVYADCQANGRLKNAGEGNVFACKKCGDPVYLDQSPAECETCDEALYYCGKCRKKLAKDVPVINALTKKKTIPCPSCPKPTESGEVLTDGVGALFTCTAVEGKNAPRRMQVWDEIESKNLFHCSRCQELWYVGEERKSYRSCPSCGKAYCPTCMKEEKVVCPECETLQEKFKLFIAAHLDEILPLLTLTDAKKLKKDPTAFSTGLRTYAGLWQETERTASLFRGSAFFRFVVKKSHVYLLTVTRVGGELIPSEKDKYKFRLEGIE